MYMMKSDSCLCSTVTSIHNRIVGGVGANISEAVLLRKAPLLSHGNMATGNLCHCFTRIIKVL